MSIEFRMPSLGPDMTAGTLVEWRIAPGTAIHRGDVIAAVETEKGVIDVEAFHDGITERLLVEPGTHVPVGTVLALFSGAGPASAVTSKLAPESQQSPAPGTRRVKASPAARARAQVLGIGVDSVAGTGMHGAITMEDVERAARAQSTPTSATATATAAMRQAIGAAMARSKREIPHYYLAGTLDFSPAVEWLETRNATQPVENRLLHAVVLIKALARASREIAGFSGYFRDGRYQAASGVHIGVAISQRGGGLVAPALLDAADKDLPTLMRELNDLVTRARTGHLRSSELMSPTITLTNLGDEGIDAVFPVIFPDQVAIIGASGPYDRPWVVEGQVAPRKILTLTLAADHRVSDGRAGARFLKRIGELARSPGEL